MDGPPVVVVGGGLAGLAAALRLAKARHPVRLYEATDRLGHAGDSAKTAAAFLSGATKLSQKAEAKNAAKVAAAAAAAKQAAKSSRSGGLGIGGTIGVLLEHVRDAAMQARPAIGIDLVGQCVPH